MSQLRNRGQGKLFGPRPFRGRGVPPASYQTLSEEELYHLLEQLWMAEEDSLNVTVGSSFNHSRTCGEGHLDSKPMAGSARCTLGTHLVDLVPAGLVTESNGNVSLTADGRARAQALIRRHRLAEMLLFEILDLEADYDEAEVCRLEHALSERTADRICAFLGHPPFCPHGRPIPRGKCCGKIRREVQPLVTPLSEGRVGEDYRIVFIVPRNHSRLDRLQILGVAPGAQLHLHQKKPSYVVKVGETDVALDFEIAREIYVRPV